LSPNILADCFFSAIMLLGKSMLHMKSSLETFLKIMNVHGDTPSATTVNFFKKSDFHLHGLQYAYKQNVKNYSGMLFCATGIDISTISPIIKKEEKWNLIELPIGTRYKILKSSKFQPYISVSFIPLYPLNYEVRQIDTDGKIVKANYQDESIIKRFDASAESGAGLNYKLNQYIFNLHTYIGYVFNLSEVGVGFSVMRKL